MMLYLSKSNANDGTRLSYILTRASNATQNEKIVIMLHGGPDGCKDGPNGIFIKLSESLCKEGIDSIRFDFTGEGESDGDYVNTTINSQKDDFYMIYDEVKRLGYKKIGIVGESFGATCALGVYDNSFSAVVLLWPAIYLLDNCFAPYYQDPYKTQLKTLGHIIVGKKRVGDKFLKELIEIDNLEKNVRQIQAPTLLIHGDTDEEVPYTQSIRAEKLLKHPKRLVIVRNGMHGLKRSHEQELVIRETIKWLTTYM